MPPTESEKIESRKREHRKNGKRKRGNKYPRTHFARFEIGSVNEIADYEVCNNRNEFCGKNNACNRHQIRAKNLVEKLCLITVYQSDAEVYTHKSECVNPHICVERTIFLLLCYQI